MFSWSCISYVITVILVMSQFLHSSCLMIVICLPMTVHDTWQSGAQRSNGRHLWTAVLGIRLASGFQGVPKHITWVTWVHIEEKNGRHPNCLAVAESRVPPYTKQLKHDLSHDFHHRKSKESTLFMSVGIHLSLGVPADFLRICLLLATSKWLNLGAWSFTFGMVSTNNQLFRQD